MTTAPWWNGAVESNNNAIINRAGSSWNGAVTGNGGESNSLAHIDNYGTWTGAVQNNAGTINTSGTWTGNFTSAGTVNAEGTISGDFANSGLLHLTGSLSGIGLLANNGTLDMGGAVDTLSAGSASFGVGSFTTSKQIRAASAACCRSGGQRRSPAR